MEKSSDEKDEVLGIGEWNGILTKYYESGKKEIINLDSNEKD